MRIYNQVGGMEFGIEMCHVHNDEWKKHKYQKEENRQIKKELERLEKKKITSVWKYWKRKKSNMRWWKKEKKRVSQTNYKISRNKAMQQESQQRNNPLGRPSCKITGTILKINEGGIKHQWTKGQKLMRMHRTWMHQYQESKSTLKKQRKTNYNGQ